MRADREKVAVGADLTASCRLGLPVPDILAELAADLDHPGLESHLARVRVGPVRSPARHDPGTERLHPAVTDAVNALSDVWRPS
ncbi:hypothetical protein [Streptomyces panaciradicis]|uniref:hypothetical protein n=1 Tax=Streptomyces panaciradicis TaxID=1470261 RepID=UPI00201CB22D|nr:hypothetical protein [Streptomyces panaciradicis]MCL6667284.1 hypothetical protein [Streptomyces panaciradicis]